MKEIEKTVDAFDKDGVVVIKDAIKNPLLTCLQNEFDNFVEEDKSRWLEKVLDAEASALFLDIQNPIERSSLFKDLIWDRSYSEILRLLTEKSLYFKKFSARITISNPISYVPWHVDFTPPHPFSVRILIYLEDVSSDEGPFAYVPGSHKLNGEYDISNRKIYPSCAGTVIIFNPFGLHRAMSNESGKPRKVVILTYQEQNY